MTLMPNLKPEQIRVSVAYPDADFVRDFAKETGLSMADVAGTLLRAAIKAARDGGGSLTLPIRLAVVTGQPKSIDEKNIPVYAHRESRTPQSGR